MYVYIYMEIVYIGVYIKIYHYIMGNITNYLWHIQKKTRIINKNIDLVTKLIYS